MLSENKDMKAYRWSFVKTVMFCFFILIMLLGTCFFGASANAIGEDLQLVAPHSGGNVITPSTPTGYNMRTIFGQPFAGISTSSTGTSTGEWGAIWWGDTGTSLITGEDNGLIYNTKIVRLGDAAQSDIQISFRSTQETSANIFRLSGTASEFATTANVWKLIAQNVPIPNTNVSDTIWTENTNKYAPAGTIVSKVLVANGNNAYYRVVPAAPLNITTNIFTFDATSGFPYNARTVGKVDFNLGYLASLGERFNLNSTPLKIATTNIAGFFGKQLDINGTEIYSYDNQSGVAAKAQFVSSATSSVWVYQGLPSGQSEMLMDRGLSYWIKLPSTVDIPVTLVGEVIQNYSANLYNNSANTGFNRIGDPYPASVDFMSAGLTPTNHGKEIYWFNNTTKVTQKLQIANGIWVNAQSDQPVFNLQPGFGYWYRLDSSSGVSVPWNFQQ